MFPTLSLIQSDTKMHIGSCDGHHHACKPIAVFNPSNTVIETLTCEQVTHRGNTNTDFHVHKHCTWSVPEGVNLATLPATLAALNWEVTQHQPKE